MKISTTWWLSILPLIPPSSTFSSLANSIAVLNRSWITNKTTKTHHFVTILAKVCSYCQTDFAHFVPCVSLPDETGKYHYNMWYMYVQWVVSTEAISVTSVWVVGCQGCHGYLQESSACSVPSLFGSYSQAHLLVMNLTPEYKVQVCFVFSCFFFLNIVIATEIIHDVNIAWKGTRLLKCMKVSVMSH